MPDNTEHTNSILKNDPDFRDLDFSALRAEGIGYVAELSGKIWTDHNVHDPGITILELLCYALIDLGYRTRMPAIDIFSRNPADTSPEDNFFTPAEILTCNPVTIMDFRKLLIDIEGVKNAWLDVNEEWLDCKQVIPTQPNVEFINLPTYPEPDDCSTFLNGLYRVQIELTKGPWEPESQWAAAEKTRIDAIVERIREVLMAHRNLCEDFVSITILCKEKIGVCADIDLDPDADAEKIYVKIVETLRTFFSPDPKFYTLKQLLDKGLPIDEVFAGRPFLEESHGFVDTAELEAIPFRKEIHVSDVYNALFAIEGIRTIRRLRLRSCDGMQKGSTENKCDCEWKYFLSENHTPEFSLDCSGFRFTLGGRPVTVNEKKYKDLFALNYSFAGKIMHGSDSPDLDLSIPQGTYRADLSEFYSIQNELPFVYGVGAGGLDIKATPERRAQALQLKGYLLFFDQLLANYLSQLGQLKKLFAFRNNAKESSTYFSALPAQVPDLDMLLQSGGGTPALIQATPVEKSTIDNLIATGKLADADLAAFERIGYSTAADRDAAIYLLMDDLQNGNFDVATVQNSCSRWIFYINTSSDQIVLIAKTDYATAEDAKNAGVNLAYVGGFKENYKTYTLGNTSDSYFSIELGMPGYGVYLQQIVEDKQLYQQRRNAFLDHLLSRFAESFTDFALLSFDSLKEDQLKQQQLAKKTSFLSSYDRLGRDRGKGYDYKTNGWNVQNISGFEQRVKAYAGIGDCCGETLCHFEVFEYTGQYYWAISAAGKELFKSTSMFDTPAESAADLEIFLKTLKDESAYKTMTVPLHDTHALAIEYKGDQVLYPTYRQQPQEAASMGAHLRQLLSGVPTGDDISVSSQIFRAQLINDRQEIVRSTQQSFENFNKATSAARPLIKKINDEDWEETVPADAKARLELKAAKGDPFQLIDIAHFGKNVTVCPDEYRWQLDNENSQPLMKSTNRYASRQLALEGLMNELTAHEIDASAFRLYAEESGFKFELSSPEGNLLAASPAFADEGQRNIAIEFIISFCNKERTGAQYTYLITEACHWQVDFGNGLVFQSLALLADPENAMNTWRKEKRSFRVKENYVWDWDEQGQLQLSVKSESGEIVARLLPQEGRESLEEEIFNRIQEALNTRSFTATTIKVEQGFGFRLRDANEQILLSGYLVYKSRGEAFFTLLRALDKASQESMYLRSGDEGNRQFTFFLKTDDRQFLAENPVLYDSEAEREEALQKTIQVLKEKHSPADGLKEPIRHTYSINTAERPLLSSVQKFATIREAGEGANNVLILAGDPANYQVHEEIPGVFTLRLVAGDQWLATVPGSFADAVIAEGARNEVVQSVRQHLYHVKVAAFDDKWKFRFSLGIGSDRVHFQSTEEYESVDAAKAAYGKMANDIPALKLQRSEGKVELVSKQKIGKTNITASLLPVAPGSSDAVADAALAVSQVLYALAVTEDSKAVQKMVKKDELAEQGTWVYRLVKKDDPYAYHLNCGKEVEDDKLIKTLHAGASSKPDYLLICLGGDIIYQRTNTGTVLYHFMIKARNVFYPGTNRDLVLFISTKGYSSPEEAEQAFNDSYLLILKRASQSIYYGDEKIISLHEPASSTGDCKKEGQNLVYVPAETMALFSDEAAAMDALTALAKSYPVRLSGKRYKFSLYDYKKNFSYFISTATYATPAEAMQAFLFLLVLIRNRKNYYLYCNPDTGERSIVIREVLLESTRRFGSSDQAWGPDGIEKLIGISQADGAFHISVNRDDCCFSFFVACKSKITHPCTYDTVKTRDQALRKLYKQFSNYQLPVFPQVNLSADGKWFEIIYEGSLLARLPVNNDFSKGGLCTQTFLDFLGWVLTIGKCPNVQGGNPFELRNSDDILMATLDNPTITKEEWIKKLVDLSLAFPVYKKDGLYYFRLLYDATSDDSVTDPCGCGQELPPDGPDCYVAWIGGCYNSCDEAFHALAALPEKFKDETRYRAVFDCACGAYRIEFIEREDIVAVNPQCYTTREMVCEAVERARRLINCEGLHLVEHILLRPRCPEDCNCLIPSSPDAACHFVWKTTEEDPCKPASSDPCFIPGSDPYSCIATVVLPAWSRRFRSAANRQLVETILYREAPSHILLRILWLSPKDCCRFESQFRLWLRWLANKKNRCNPFDMCSFIGLLFRNDLDCWWPEEYCAPCGNQVTQSPCDELNNRQELGTGCNLTVNDIYDWNTPDCCYEYQRVSLDVENESEKMKIIRKRSTRYVERLAQVQRQLPEDENMGLAMSYIKGNKPDEERLVRIAGELNNKNVDKDKIVQYRQTLDILLAFYLDRSLLDEYDSKKLSDIKRTVRKLGLEKGEGRLVLNNWSAGEVNNFVHPKTFSALQGIFKK
jgi:uncharacterized protein YegP (UPF0339 family)